MTEEKKNENTFTDEDVKKMEDDVKKAIGEEQGKKVQEAIEATKKEMAAQKELDELKEKQDELTKQLEDKDKAYAENLEKMKVEAQANLDSAITQIKDERQSTVKTDNPFKEKATDEKESLKREILNDPVKMAEVDAESAAKFAEKYGIPLSNLPIK